MTISTNRCFYFQRSTHYTEQLSKYSRQHTGQQVYHQGHIPGQPSNPPHSVSVPQQKQALNKFAKLQHELY